MKNLLSEILGRRFKKIGFLGLGKSNLSLISALPLDGIELTLRSEGKIDESLLPRGVSFSKVLCEKNAFSDISEDILILSPSVRRERCELKEAVARGILFTSDAELFFDGVGEREVFAVSGSDGKSTTVTLLSKILEEKRKVALIGNIGSPMLKSLSGDYECFAAELSSFMLRYAKPRVKRAAITNITPNHLNWHSSFEEYKSTKLSLIENAREAVLSVDDIALSEYCKSHEVFAITSTNMCYKESKKHYKCNFHFTFDRKYIYKNGEPFLKAEDIQRKEMHNVKNLMCAMALAEGYYTDRHLLKVAREFQGLAHRAETVFVRDGVEYIDSSIDTSPDRTRSTLLALQKQVVLILGGRGKGADYGALASAVSLYAKKVIICGEDREKIFSAIAPHAECEVYEKFDSAVMRACEISKCAEAVLLSPAATSYDEFRSFEERAEKFKDIIRNYYKQ